MNSPPNSFTNEELSILYKTKCIDSKTKESERGKTLFIRNYSKLQFNKSINFSSAGFGSESITKLLSIIPTHPTLRILNISGNSIGQNSVSLLSRYLSTNKDLIQLDVSSCNMNDQCCAILFESLKFNKSLIELSIKSESTVGRNSIGEKASIKLAEMLKCNTILSNLNLSNCEIIEKTIMTIADGLSKNKTLSSLVLSHNNIKFKGISYLIGKINESKVTELYLSSCSCRDENSNAFSNLFAKNRNIKILDISHNAFTEKFLKNIAVSLEKSTVEVLILAYNDFSRGDLIYLADPLTKTPIRSLNITKCSLNGKDLKRFNKFFKENRSLQEFIADHNNFYAYDGIALAEFVQSNPSLRYISFNQCEMEDKNFEPMFKVMQEKCPITRISLISNSIKNAEPIKKILENNKNIIKFDLEKNDIIYQEIVDIEKMISDNRKKQRSFENIIDLTPELCNLRGEITHQRDKLSSLKEKRESLENDAEKAKEQLIDVKKLENELEIRAKKLAADFEEHAKQIDQIIWDKEVVDTNYMQLCAQFDAEVARQDHLDTMLYNVNKEIKIKEKHIEEEMKQIVADLSLKMLAYVQAKDKFMETWEVSHPKKPKTTKKKKKVATGIKKVPTRIADTGILLKPVKK